MAVSIQATAQLESPIPSPPLQSQTFYAGNLQRFFQCEVLPVNFGVRADAFLLLKMTLLALLLVNLFGVFIFMLDDDFYLQQARLHSNQSRLLKILFAFEAAASSYYKDGHVVIGILLAIWFIGYNVISAVIWWQFERHELMPADDFEIVGVVGRGRSGNNAPTGPNHATGDEKPAAPHQPHEQNPFDRSVTVVTLPGNNFTIAKKQNHPTHAMQQ